MHMEDVQEFSLSRIELLSHQTSHDREDKDYSYVHTKPDKFENATFATKPDKMFSVHINRFQKVPFSPSTLTHLAGVFKFLHFGERFQQVPFSDTENTVLVWTEGLSG